MTAAFARHPGFIAWLLLAFALRLAFGLVSEFWGEDELQVYLIGLQFYTTGVWPYFGPDVVYTQTEIPGGLQGLLVGGPLWIVAQPEAPYVLLNLMSFGALLLLGWYIARRVPATPRWFLWPWVFFSPWTLNLSAHVVNPSYVLIGGVLFFVGSVEAIPPLARGLLRRPVAFFCLGFGVIWIYQLHLSAALLVPIAIAVLIFAAREDLRGTVRDAVWLIIGAVVAGATLIPTILAIGLGGLAASTGENITFDPRNLLRLPEVVAQFFSFATFEIARFLGPGTADRLAFLARYPWAAPFIVIGALCGIVQLVSLLIGLVGRRPSQPDWPAIRAATVAILLLVYGSFVLAVRPPASHAFYVVLPLVFIYAFHCWAAWFRNRLTRAIAVVLLLSTFVTHIAIAARNFTDRSLYTRRDVVMRAIEERNHHYVGERRQKMWKR